MTTRGAPEADNLEQFREKVRTILMDRLPPSWEGIGRVPADQQSTFRDAWRAHLHAHGLLAVQWPAAYGGSGMSPAEQVIVAEECTRVGVPQGGLNDNFGIQMLGSTLLKFGTEDQKHQLLPAILSGEQKWCQGFSEPDAGSDLAGLRTSAVLDGDEWVIEGQKIWTSYAHLASHIFVLCRTSSTGPRKHDGLSILLVEIDQPGIEVRPLKTMTGEAEFNEVFFTGARCGKSEVLGEVGQGWTVAMTLLGFERGEAAATLPIRFRADFDRLLLLARERGRTEDPDIRRRLASCFGRVEEMRCLGQVALDRWLEGADIGPESSLHKLLWSEWIQDATELALDILGTESITPQGEGLQGVSFPASEAGSENTSGTWVDYFMRARAATIYAGSNEIQRNIVAERLLGLPREARTDR
ncbi:MAG: putative Acyl-CoA dehydrogenase [Aeromicrobium sp.]|nr:putative Acyl-CoA dehydrogenase [Aeromicrobium sp.]